MDVDSPTIPKQTWRLRPAERRSTLFFGDLLVAVLALLVALYFWSQGGEWYKFSWAFLQERVPFWFYLLPVFWLLLLTESYNPRRSTIRMETIREITVAVFVCSGLYLILFFFSAPFSLPRRGVAGFIASVYLLTLIWRLGYIQLFTAPLFLRRILIVGAGQAGTQLTKIIKDIWPPPFFLVGLVDDDPEKIGKEIEGFPVLGGSDHLFDIVSEHQVSDLVFAISGEMKNKMFERLLEAEEKGVEVTTMPTMYEELLGRIPIFQLQSDWVLRSFVDHAHISGFYDLGKRLIDIVGGIVGVLLLVLTFPLIALLIWLNSGVPIFYKQVRLGKNGRSFSIIKYRTMVKDAERDGIPRTTEENDSRLTKIGKILRKTHLDELPQFLNILRGDMSLVGPRSERPELVDMYQHIIPFYRARLFVKPGLTGWAQVNYGYASNIDENAEKLEFDLFYIKRRNLFLDLQIMVRTLGTVIGFKGR